MNYAHYCVIQNYNISVDQLCGEARRSGQDSADGYTMLGTINILKLEHVWFTCEMSDAAELAEVAQAQLNASSTISGLQVKEEVKKRKHIKESEAK